MRGRRTVCALDDVEHLVLDYYDGGAELSAVLRDGTSHTLLKHSPSYLPQVAEFIVDFCDVRLRQEVHPIYV